MLPFPNQPKLQIVFCALETYSLVGGLQNFNRRVVKGLIWRANSRGEAPPEVHVLRDRDSVPKNLSIDIKSYPTRTSYLFRSAVSSLKANMFVIGHVNLLPLAAMVRCLRWRMPILLFVHGDEVWNEPTRRKKRWYDRLFLLAVNRIASVSQHTADVMAKEFRLSPTKFTVLPNAVDSIDLPRCGPEKEAPVVLTVSRLSSGDRQKNIDQMLKSIALVKERVPDVRYEVVGDGPLRDELQRLADDLGISGNVSFLGRLSETELAQAYLRAAVFALPSSKEGFGIVYLEAWLRLLPVLCSSFGAAKEVVSDGRDGFVVDHRDCDAIADRLHELLTDRSLARRFGEHGRKKVETKYLNSSFQTNLNAIIDDLQVEFLASGFERPPTK
ncbi:MULTISPECIES: glycosyltransferase family 4 protein [unclassified Bradyrhizobium]|uniref:glycosyltransferase family 4 protein n=1 Tax=unclassified Bradyrhizobium TaxID=2631580 RepID=UPI001FF8570C|nr:MULTISPECIES: glycosyltransferase family 4 protein [unclassified Bradyrhizobium]MCK1305151.1 glycosyltransferase family 4 protein [Bradyrhizobium sp. 45]MCK1612673.1 glycosyltransferase family 4 protein [Bradyrhizobium sp. 163]MCK1765543.1 glycosyltransferase family 4 protein [Bradyrhizobium sp. 136]